MFALVFYLIENFRLAKIYLHFAEGKLSFCEADYHSAKQIITLAKRDYYSAEGG